MNKFHFCQIMDHLHAYWRMEYVSVPQDQKTAEGDPFERIPHEDLARSLLLFKSSFSYATLNKFPYNAGHILVIPYRKVSDITELSEEESRDLWCSIIKAEKLLKKTIHPDGFNIGFNLGAAAGAGIPEHIHCHIVPRWNGDTNFMPVIGKTKVLSQALEEMAKQLREVESKETW